LRACRRIGPNAFGLPGGTIVVTDALAQLAQNSAQVSAVLAHEVGHVRERQVLRQMLQAAGVATLISALGGNSSAVTGLAVAVPALLLESGYSREFEDEADSYALQRLKEIGVAPNEFAEILKRLLEFENNNGGKAQRKHSLDYVSTHPVTAPRIERALPNP
jgi:predicted Zn-dependent protease